MTGAKTYTIVLDVMGADGGIDAIVQGGVDGAVRLGETVNVTLVGRRELVEASLARATTQPPNLAIEHAETAVPMEAHAMDGVRMRDSSIAVGLQLLKSGKGDAFVSPGNTGAVMGSALLGLGRIKGVVRPAIASAFPTWTDRPTVVLDVGANADCKPVHLSQFAVMGSVYSSVIFDLEAPRVGLLSIGEERSKGNDLIFNARELLKNSKINFVGHAEGHDILSGAVDVAVTDGFTGNILLKFAESIRPMLVKSMQRQVQTNIFSRIGATLLLPFLKRMEGRFDYAKAGGAPLLGVNGNVIICHGASNSRAISNAISVAFEMASKKIIERTQQELETNHFGQSNGSKDSSQNNRDRVMYSAAADDER